MPPLDDPATISIHQEHDDLAAMMYHAMMLEQACRKYESDAQSIEPKFSSRPAGDPSLPNLLQQIAAVTAQSPNNQLLHLQTLINVRVKVLAPKNIGL